MEKCLHRSEQSFTVHKWPNKKTLIRGNLANRTELIALLSDYFTTGVSISQDHRKEETSRLVFKDWCSSNRQCCCFSINRLGLGHKCRSRREDFRIKIQILSFSSNHNCKCYNWDESDTSEDSGKPVVFRTIYTVENVKMWPCEGFSQVSTQTQRCFFFCFF